MNINHNVSWPLDEVMRLGVLERIREDSLNDEEEKD